MSSFEDPARPELTWEGAMAHAKRLAERAAALLARDAQVEPVAVICSPDEPSVRDLLPRLLQTGDVQPDDWVALLLPRAEAVKLLRGSAPAALEWLADPVGVEGERRLPVIVVTPKGVRVGHEPYPPEGAAAPAPRPLRVPCTVHAMLVCREAFQNGRSGRWCVIGTHDTVRAERLPCMHGFALFLSLGDFASGSKLEIRIRRGDDEIAKAELEAGLAAQVGQLDVGVPFPPLTFAKAGVYDIDLLSNGKVLASRPLTVEEHPR